MSRGEAGAQSIVQGSCYNLSTATVINTGDRSRRKWGLLGGIYLDTIGVRVYERGLCRWEGHDAVLV